MENHMTGALSSEGQIMDVKTVKEAVTRKMLAQGRGQHATESFLRLMSQVADVESAYVPLDEVSTPDTNLLLNTAFNPEETRRLEKLGRGLLSRVALLKLNGGRATTMGGETPKGVLVAKDGLSYLEIVDKQMEALEKAWGVKPPLIIMNSFFTEDPTQRVMKQHGIRATTFLQSDAPRLVEDLMTPLDTGTEEDWAPLGHGDVYASLYHTGILDQLLAQGCQWILISNMVNLAASLDPWILGLLERDRIEFLLEVTERAEVDRKGGTLIARNGRLDLLEIAQVSPSERDRFMDIEQFRPFNTNNVWVDLKALVKSLRNGVLRMSVIRNLKTVVGTRVVQLETAMGAAVGCFERARGLLVGRDRFFPTKNVEDLFLLQYDAGVLDSMYRIRRNPSRPAHLPLRPRVTFWLGFS
ncbi:UTP--glucose-1-phosphate uridylyltransferase [Thermodesulfobacteriota bacterium]